LVFESVGELGIGLLYKYVIVVVLRDISETELLFPVKGLIREAGLRKEVNNIFGVYFNGDKGNEL